MLKNSILINVKEKKSNSIRILFMRHDSYQEGSAPAPSINPNMVLCLLRIYNELRPFALKNLLILSFYSNFLIMMKFGSHNFNKRFNALLVACFICFFRVISHGSIRLS